MHLAQLLSIIVQKRQWLLTYWQNEMNLCETKWLTAWTLRQVRLRGCLEMVGKPLGDWSSTPNSAGVADSTSSFPLAGLKGGAHCPLQKNSSPLSALQESLLHPSRLRLCPYGLPYLPPQTINKNCQWCQFKLAQGLSQDKTTCS